MSIVNSLDVPSYQGEGLDVLSQQRKSIQNLSRFSTNSELPNLDEETLEKFRKEEEKILRGLKDVSETNEELNDLALRLQNLNVYKASNQYSVVKSTSADDLDHESDNNSSSETPTSSRGRSTSRIIRKNVPKPLKKMKKALMKSIKKHDKDDLNPTKQGARKRSKSAIDKERQAVANFLK